MGLGIELDRGGWAVWKTPIKAPRLDGGPRSLGFVAKLTIKRIALWLLTKKRLVFAGPGLGGAGF